MQHLWSQLRRKICRSVRANVHAKSLQLVMFCNPPGPCRPILNSYSETGIFYFSFDETRSRLVDRPKLSHYKGAGDSGSTSTSIPSSYASRPGKTHLRPSKSLSAKWISTGITIQSTHRSVLGRWNQHSASNSSVAAESRFPEFNAPSSHTLLLEQAKLVPGEPSQIRRSANLSNINSQTSIASKTRRRMKYQKPSGQVYSEILHKPSPSRQSRQRFLQRV